MLVTNLGEFIKTGLLISLCDFYLCTVAFVHCNVCHDKDLHVCDTKYCKLMQPVLHSHK